MIDYMSYYADNMGLHEILLRRIEGILIRNRPSVVAEFGSGNSTRFLIDMNRLHRLGMNVVSFDHNPRYAFSGADDCLVSHIRRLVKCTDCDYEEMFKAGLIDWSKMVPADHLVEDFSVRNAFYRLEENDIPSHVDMVILDGPNGNGRNFAFLALKERMTSGCHIVIDDSDHYDFIERCISTTGAELLVHESRPEIHPLFNYAILRLP